MNQFRYLALLLLLTLPLLLVRCTSEGGDDKLQALALAAANIYEKVAVAPATYSNPAVGYEAIPVTIPEQDLGKNVSFQYTLDLNGATRDVFFTFTNIDASSSTWYPSLDSSLSVMNQTAVPDTFETDRTTLLNTDDAALRGTPEISEFNRSPWEFLNQVNPVNMLLNSIDFPEPMPSDYKDAQSSFKISAFTSINATCRYVSNPAVSTAFGSKTLSIWVADDQWTTQPALYPNKVTQDMVDVLVSKFLIAGLDNDIYDWVTNIYGDVSKNTAEWGPVSGSSLSPSAKTMMIPESNQITILLFDIDPPGVPGDGGVVGYFWAKDNFKSSAISYSNERVMFYMDSIMFAHSDGGAWDITDKWPSTVISILSHEFQHMIHFYQKTVMRSYGQGSETWLDEMCALATEDLVADKVHVDGPRGVSYLDYSDGDSPNTTDRLSRYNFYNNYSVTKWYSGDDVFASYSINYAFGAYLMRNFGGAQFFHDVMHNEFTDQAAIEDALNKAGYTLSFGEVLQQWAVANLLSDKTTTAAGYKYNDSTPLVTFASTVNTKPYTIGAINLDNYLYVTQNGPYIRDTMKTGSMPQASNYYYRAGTGLTGEQTWNIKLKSRVRMNVVVK